MSTWNLSCRLCRQTEGIMVDIFEEYDSSMINMSNMLLDCVGLQVLKDDNYSNFLCNECANELLISYEFRQKCLKIMCTEKSDILETLVHNTGIEEEEEEEVEDYIVFDADKVEVDFSPTYICDVCGAFFKQSFTLRRHLMKEHPNELFMRCLNCDYCFSKKDNYKEHFHICSLNHNNNNNSNSNNKTTCNYCGKVFNNEYALNMHLRTHTGERPFPCDLCSKTFKTRCHLNNHRKRHLEEPQYSCEFCKKLFYEKGNLIVHMRTHTGEKLHECKVCGKKFGRVFLLQLHRRIHTGEMPFECDICQQRFKQRSELQYHRVKHTGLSPFKCEWCEKVFRKDSQLQHHLNTVCNKNLPIIEVEINNLDDINNEFDVNSLIEEVF